MIEPSSACVNDAAAATTVRFSMRVYDLDTIKKAAYRLGNCCTADITLEGEDIVCTLHRLPGARSVDLAAAIRTEVLDQDLRAKTAAETAPIRNAILAYAFSRTGLQEGE